MLKRLAINTTSNLAQLVIAMAITFVMAPIYLKMMGHHDYGLREMVMAMVGYMGMLDMGMKPTVSRFASMHNATRDRQELLVVYASSLVFMALVGVLLAVFFWVWALSFPSLLAPESADDVTKYSLFLLIVGAQLLFAFPRSVTESYLEGLQRYYVKNVINITSSILIAVICYNYMTPSNALLLLVGLISVSVFIKLVIFAAMLWRPALGGIYPNFHLFSWSKLREMLQFGLKSFIQGASHKVETMSDRLVIGSILGPALVPIYTIPFTLVSYINSITMTLTHTFMPLFSDLNARGQQHRIRNVYLFSSKVIVGLVMPMGVGINLVGPAFIDVWMKGQFDPATVSSIIFLLTLYIVVPKLNPFASRYLTAINEHGIFARVAPFAALANLALSIWAVTQIGVVGAALGSVFPAFVVTPIFLQRACQHLGISMIGYVKRCLLPAIIPSVIMGVVVFWMRQEFGLTDYARIVAAIVLGGIVYAVLFWLVALRGEERQWLLDRFFRKKGLSG